MAMPTTSQVGCFPDGISTQTCMMSGATRRLSVRCVTFTQPAFWRRVNTTWRSRRFTFGMTRALIALMWNGLSSSHAARKNTKPVVAREVAEPPAQAQLGRPRPGHHFGLQALVALGDLGPDVGRCW